MHTETRTTLTAGHYDAIVPKTMSFSVKSGVDVPLAVDGKDIVQSGHNPQGFLDFLNVFMCPDRTPATFARTVDTVTDSVAKARWDNGRR